MVLVEIVHALKHGAALKDLVGTVGQGLFEVFETFSMFLSNTISYSRLIILAVVHAMIMLAIYSIAENEIIASITIANVAILSLLIMIGGNILVLVLEGLIVFIHTIRLHFYEWFTKFFESGGLKYVPFIFNREYTEAD